MKPADSVLARHSAPEVDARPVKPTAIPPQERIDRITQVRDHGNYTTEQVILIRNTVAKGATEDELKLFLAVCARTGLDPFMRQIHFVKRWDAKLSQEVGAIQTGIDGYRVIAERSGDYAGQGPKEWCGKDGRWTDVWLEDGHPHACRATVWRRGLIHPFTAVVRYSAYVQTTKDKQTGEQRPNRTWNVMDAEQLGKCAEAAALRMAFPNQLAGIYTDDEMGQADAAAELAASSSVTQIGKGVDGLKGALGMKDAPPAGDDSPAADAAPTVQA